MPATSGQCQASPDPDHSAAPLSWTPAESKLSVASSDKAGVIGGWGEVMGRLETLLLPGSRRVSALCHRSSHCACPESASGRGRERPRCWGSGWERLRLLAPCMFRA